MGKFIIAGGKPICGKIRVNGAKNSVLPIIAASLLGTGESIIEDVPRLDDVSVMCELMLCIGAEVEMDRRKRTVRINAEKVRENTAPYDLVNKMRASFLVMGPLLARTGYAKISLPGGCAIGSRPVDLHLKGFCALGASIEQGNGYIKAKSKGRLKGNRIYLDFPSVGATENILMASVLAEGQTIIENAASEPEVVDLAAFLIKMGADVKGAGTDTIKIRGVESLSGTKHTLIPDRIEAGTFMAAAAITGGDLIIENVVPDHVKPVCAKLKEAGVEISEELTSIRVTAPKRLTAVDIKTLPHPGFPTDMQSQIASVMSVADGTSMIVETIFDNRFMHVGELKRMGAKIKIDGRSAVIEGIKRLNGAEVEATDLRAGAALVLAGLAAKGTTQVFGIEHIDRGYEHIDRRLNNIGADIVRTDHQ